MTRNTMHVGLIGFGEVGQILAEDLLRGGQVTVSAWDVLFAQADSVPSRAARSRGMTVAGSAADAAANADLVICAVTAAQDAQAAKQAAAGLREGCFFFDLNSASPAQKRAAAAAVDGAGGRYVEGAVMSPVPTKRVASPILLGGAHAAAFLPIAQALGFSGAKAFASAIGTASAAKMCRSVMVKGIEALLMESLVTARHYGVENSVLASLSDLFPGCDWPVLSRYMISRSIEHGVRRAEEMREVAVTVADAGVAPSMSAACAERQDWAAQFTGAHQAESLTDMLDAVLAARVPMTTES